MKEYHKIQTVYKRNLETGALLEGEWTLPEFEFLQDNQWVWTEKIDGTNIRIILDELELYIKGKSEKAEVPLFLLKRLHEIFTQKNLIETFPELSQVCLYGEGYGDKIQKGRNYIPDGTNFILFDCRIGYWWLTRDSLEQIAKAFSIPIVPIIGEGTLAEGIEYCRQGFKSVIADNKDYDAEGLVLKPKVELLNRQGRRIITKLKYKDFKNETNEKKKGLQTS